LIKLPGVVFSVITYTNLSVREMNVRACVAWALRSGVYHRLALVLLVREI